MLKQLQIRNLKSYSGLHDVPLSSINIIAGANSSGKSTVVQSLLLLKQTLLYGSRERALLLNGPLLRMGSFKDVINSRCGDTQIGVSLSYDFTQAEMSRITNDWFRPSQVYFPSSHRNSYISRLTAEFTWDRPDTLTLEDSGQTRFNPDLASAMLAVSRTEESIVTVSHVLTRQWRDGETKSYSLPYAVELDRLSREEITASKPDSYIIGGEVDRFLPQYIAIDYDLCKKKSLDISNAIFSSGSYFFAMPPQYSEIELPQGALGYISKWLVDAGKDPLPDAVRLTVSQVKSLVDKVVNRHSFLTLSVGPASERRTAVDTTEATAAVREILERELPTEREFDFSLPSSIRQGVALLTEYFNKAVRYLGPLRDPPRPVYQLEALPSTTDVGYRGEHTAAVLDLNRDRSVLYYRPPGEGLENDYASVAVLVRASLHDAVVEWLSYLGVAEEVTTSDEGVFGNRLQVATQSGAALHDLTNVGVGVSQVLPIVVMALLSPEGGFLIFEQPELHLHPRVQARLADFFISLSLSGRQVLAETHSEYLVDRFRLRVALSENNQVQSMLSILFSERQDGDTSLLPIEINEFGAITNWPKDFFDQSQSDVARILKAASAKRSRQRNL